MWAKLVFSKWQLTGHGNLTGLTYGFIHPGIPVLAQMGYSWGIMFRGKVAWLKGLHGGLGLLFVVLQNVDFGCPQTYRDHSHWIQPMSGYPLLIHAQIGTLWVGNWFDWSYSIVAGLHLIGIVWDCLKMIQTPEIPCFLIMFSHDDQFRDRLGVFLPHVETTHEAKTWDKDKPIVWCFCKYHQIPHHVIPSPIIHR